MSLIKCNECGKDISNKAQSCPNCGCPVKIKKTQVEILEEYRKSNSYLNDKIENCNEFFIEKGFEPINSDYDISILEKNVFEILKGSKNENNEIDFSVIYPISHDLCTLFEKKGEYKYKFYIDSYLKAFYIKKLLDNNDYVIAEEIGIFISKYDIKYLSDLGISIYKNSEKTTSEILYNNNFDIHQVINKLEENTKEWENAAKIVLRPILNKIIDLSSDYKMGKVSYIDLEMDIIKEHFFHIYNKYLKKEIPNVKIFLGRFMLIISYYNLYLSVGVKYNYDINKLEFLDIKNKSEIHYGSFSQKDKYKYEIHETKVPIVIDYSNLKPQKKVSVIRRTLIGNILAGSKGAVIGALSAIDKNNNTSTSNVPMSTSSYHNIKSCTIRMYLYNMKELRYFYLYSNDSLKLFIEFIQEQTNYENVLKGDLIKKYYKETNSQQFDEEKLNEYIAKNFNAIK